MVVVVVVVCVCVGGGGGLGVVLVFKRPAMLDTLDKQEQFELYTGWPQKTEQSIQSIFQDFALNNSYLFSHCWIEFFSLIIITPKSSNLVENFLFYESFLMDCHFRDLPDFQSSKARLMTASPAHAPTHTSIQPATNKSQCQ